MGRSGSKLLYTLEVEDWLDVYDSDARRWFPGQVLAVKSGKRFARIAWYSAQGILQHREFDLANEVHVQSLAQFSSKCDTNAGPPPCITMPAGAFTPGQGRAGRGAARSPASAPPTGKPSGSASALSTNLPLTKAKSHGPARRPSGVRATVTTEVAGEEGAGSAAALSPQSPPPPPPHALSPREMELQELGKQLFIVTAVSAPSAASEAPHDECVSIGDLLDVKDKHGVWHVAEVLDMRRDPQTQYPAVKVLLHAGRSEAQWLHFGAEQIARFGMHTSASVQHPYVVDEYVDVLDKFLNRRRQYCEKWRLCQILDVRPHAIFVRWEGYGPHWNQWIDVAKEPDRVRPAFGKTDVETEAERDRRELEQNFRDALVGQGWAVHDMERDGNCLFRSVAHQVFGDPEQHDSLRTACCDYMLAHHAHFGMFVEGDFGEYIAEKRRSRCWGDDLEILALEEMLDRPIEVYQPGSLPTQPMNILRSKDRLELIQHVQPIRLSYHGGSHYNSVVELERQPPLGMRDTSVLRDARLARADEGEFNALRRRSAITGVPRRASSMALEADIGEEAGEVEGKAGEP